jgi:hypothetical protein
MTSVRFFGAAAVAALDGRNDDALSIVADACWVLLPIMPNDDEDWRNPSVDLDGTAAWLRSLCAQTGELMEVV